MFFATFFVFSSWRKSGLYRTFGHCRRASSCVCLGIIRNSQLEQQEPIIVDCDEYCP
jgi:hypothetical protein